MLNGFLRLCQNHLHFLKQNRSPRWCWFLLGKQPYSAGTSCPCTGTWSSARQFCYIHRDFGHRFANNSCIFVESLRLPCLLVTEIVESCEIMDREIIYFIYLAATWRVAPRLNLRLEKDTAPGDKFVFFGPTTDNNFRSALIDALT